jgi:hypothetical protein
MSEDSDLEEQGSDFEPDEEKGGEEKPKKDKKKKEKKKKKKKDKESGDDDVKDDKKKKKKKDKKSKGATDDELDDVKDKKKKKKKKDKKDRKIKGETDNVLDDGKKKKKKKDKKKDSKDKKKKKKKKDKKDKKMKESVGEEVDKSDEVVEDESDEVVDEPDEEEVDAFDEGGVDESDEEEVDEQEEVEPVAVNIVKPQAADSDDDSDAGSENSEDARMRILLNAWDDDDEKSDGSSSSDDSDDDSEDEEDAAIRPIIDLKYNVLDHVVLAAPDFVEALKEFEKMTGIKPEIVGSLRGMGTKSARVGLDNNCYLEILAPDPKKAGPLTAQLESLEEGTLTPFHFAIRRDDIGELKDNYIPNELGWEPDHIGMGGTSADGTPTPYYLCFMHGHKMGGIVPFYIEWGECEHPTATIPEVGNLKRFTVRAPGGHQIHSLLKDVDYVSTEIGEPSLEFSFGSPEGIITFSGENPLGLKFPGMFNRLNGK